MVYGYLIGGLEHDWIMIFQKQLGIIEAQLTNLMNSIIFQRGRWVNHQPAMVKNTNFFSKTAPRSAGMMEDLPVVGWFHHNMLCFASAKEDCMDSLSYHFVGDNDLPKWGVEISDLGHLYIFIL